MSSGCTRSASGRPGRLRAQRPLENEPRVPPGARGTAFAGSRHSAGARLPPAPRPLAARVQGGSGEGVLGAGWREPPTRRQLRGLRRPPRGQTTGRWGRMLVTSARSGQRPNGCLGRCATRGKQHPRRDGGSLWIESAPSAWKWLPREPSGSLCGATSNDSCPVTGDFRQICVSHTKTP